MCPKHLPKTDSQRFHSVPHLPAHKTRGLGGRGGQKCGAGGTRLAVMICPAAALRHHLRMRLSSRRPAVRRLGGLSLHPEQRDWGT